ncbi:putative Inositol hexakisphosphate and diphosphoinositol-pentakisphosphate kinase [Blattamonas nauphoetae]|uniref:diphosphoinositol-pentakisphosphate 1-kinase n=1 Tax=Blattamonas nauphoetae TaxID=2049346 RepID=A0ABQ9YFH1_9EUKA|nr:putative Inositol hexakisphosphate and diphosphoinositol-pentakisphosphate kinase [Blattamonas nauphoetae]
MSLVSVFAKSLHSKSPKKIYLGNLRDLLPQCTPQGFFRIKDETIIRFDPTLSKQKNVVYLCLHFARSTLPAFRSLSLSELYLDQSGMIRFSALTFEIIHEIIKEQLGETSDVTPKPSLESFAIIMLFVCFGAEYTLTCLQNYVKEITKTEQVKTLDASIEKCLELESWKPNNEDNTSLPSTELDFTEDKRDLMWTFLTKALTDSPPPTIPSITDIISKDGSLTKPPPRAPQPSPLGLPRSDAPEFISLLKACFFARRNETQVEDIIVHTFFDAIRPSSFLGGDKNKTPLKEAAPAGPSTSQRSLMFTYTSEDIKKYRQSLITLCTSLQLSVPIQASISPQIGSSSSHLLVQPSDTSSLTDDMSEQSSPHHSEVAHFPSTQFKDIGQTPPDDSHFFHDGQKHFLPRSVPSAVRGEESDHETSEIKFSPLNEIDTVKPENTPIPKSSSDIYPATKSSNMLTVEEEEELFTPTCPACGNPLRNAVKLKKAISPRQSPCPFPAASEDEKEAAMFEEIPSPSNSPPRQKLSVNIFNHFSPSGRRLVSGGSMSALTKSLASSPHPSSTSPSASTYGQSAFPLATQTIGPYYGHNPFFMHYSSYLTNSNTFDRRYISSLNQRPSAMSPFTHYSQSSPINTFPYPVSSPLTTLYDPVGYPTRHDFHQVVQEQPSINVESYTKRFEFDTEQSCVLGICCMDKKTKSQPMKEILSRIKEHGDIKIIYFGDEVILNRPVLEWPHCDILLSFYSDGFPLQKAQEYVQLHHPFMINDLFEQEALFRRDTIYTRLIAHNIPVPNHVIVYREDFGRNTNPAEVHDLPDRIIVNKKTIRKPYVEKSLDAENHDVWVYYPPDMEVEKGKFGGVRKLFRKVDNKSSEYDPTVKHIRTDQSYLYEEFIRVDKGMDVKVYAVLPDYVHSELRKTPTKDGIVERDQNNKERREVTLVSEEERRIARTIGRIFKQRVCGFDFLRRTEDKKVKTYVCDVNGWSFVKGDPNYYEGVARILRNLMLQAKARLKQHIESPLPESQRRVASLKKMVCLISPCEREPKEKLKVLISSLHFPKTIEFFRTHRSSHETPHMKSEGLESSRPSMLVIHPPRSAHDDKGSQPPISRETSVSNLIPKEPSQSSSSKGHSRIPASSFYSSITNNEALFTEFNKILKEEFMAALSNENFNPNNLFIQNGQVWKTREQPSKSTKDSRDEKKEKEPAQPKPQTKTKEEKEQELREKQDKEEESEKEASKASRTDAINKLKLDQAVSSKIEKFDKTKPQASAPVILTSSPHHSHLASPKNHPHSRPQSPQLQNTGVDRPHSAGVQSVVSNQDRILDEDEEQAEQLHFRVMDVSTETDDVIETVNSILTVVSAGRRGLKLEASSADVAPDGSLRGLFTAPVKQKKDSQGKQGEKSPKTENVSHARLSSTPRSQFSMSVPLNTPFNTLGGDSSEVEDSILPPDTVFAPLEPVPPVSYIVLSCRWGGVLSHAGFRSAQTLGLFFRNFLLEGGHKQKRSRHHLRRSRRLFRNDSDSDGFEFALGQGPDRDKGEKMLRHAKLHSGTKRRTRATAIAFAEAFFKGEYGSRPDLSDLANPDALLDRTKCCPKSDSLIVGSTIVTCEQHENARIRLWEMKSQLKNVLIVNREYGYESDDYDNPIIAALLSSGLKKLGNPHKRLLHIQSEMWKFIRLINFKQRLNDPGPSNPEQETEFPIDNNIRRYLDSISANYKGCGEESLGLIRQRWKRLAESLRKDNGSWNTTVIMPIYQNLKWDITHNKELAPLLSPLFEIVAPLAQFLMPLYYGILRRHRVGISADFSKHIIKHVMPFIVNQKPKDEENTAIEKAHPTNVEFLFTDETTLCGFVDQLLLSDVQGMHAESLSTLGEMNYASYAMMKLYESPGGQKWTEVLVSTGLNDNPYQIVDENHCLPQNQPIVLHDCIRPDDIIEKFINRNISMPRKEQLKGIIGVFRHADRKPKQKMKLTVHNMRLLDHLFGTSQYRLEGIDAVFGRLLIVSQDSYDKKEFMKQFGKGKGNEQQTQQPDPWSQYGPFDWSPDPEQDELVWPSNVLLKQEYSAEQFDSLLSTLTEAIQDIYASSTQVAKPTLSLKQSQTDELEGLINLRAVLSKSFVGTKAQVKPTKVEVRTVRVVDRKVQRKRPTRYSQPRMSALDDMHVYDRQATTDGIPSSNYKTTDSLESDNLRTRRVVVVTEAQMIVKWGGSLTHAGHEQARNLGLLFREAVLPLDRAECHTFLENVRVRTNGERRVQRTARAFTAAMFGVDHHQPLPIMHSPELLDIIPDDIRERLLVTKKRMSKTHPKNTTHQSPGKDPKEKEAGGSPALNAEKGLASANSLTSSTTQLNVVEDTHDKFESSDEEDDPFSFISDQQLKLDVLESMPWGLQKLGNPLAKLVKLDQGIRVLHDDLARKVEQSDPFQYYATMCEHETFRSMSHRWEKAILDLHDRQTDKWDPTKIGDIYDSIKFDVIHMKEVLKTLTVPMEDLLQNSKSLADFWVTQEHGISFDDKLEIGRGIAGPLMREIISDIESAAFGSAPSVNLFFTSESHIHGLLNLLLLSGVDGLMLEREKMTDLDYLSHFIFKVYEAEASKTTRVEVFLSAGAITPNPKIDVGQSHCLPIESPMLVQKTLFRDGCDREETLALQFVIDLSMSLALLVLFAVSQGKQFYYSVQKTETGAKVSTGKLKDAPVQLRYEDTIKKEGFSHLEISTLSEQTTSTSYLMGYGEGYVLQKQISNHYGNVMEYVEKNVFKTEETKTKVVEFFKQNLEYIKEQCKTSPDSPYWKTVNRFIEMNRGITEGFNDAAKKADRTELDFYIYQSIDTIREITDWLTGAEVPSVQELIQYQTGTVLARLAKKSADLIVGHNTYGTYNALNRVEKRYNFFEPHSYKIGGTSQPGMIFPVSSANVVNKKYVFAAVTMIPTVKADLPTTHANYVPGWLALAVSTYLTNDPTYEKEKVTRDRFLSAFDLALAMPSYHQVLIVDYSKFTRKADPEAECVSIFENGPTASHTEDLTKGLKDNAKMNVLLLNVPCQETIKANMNTAEFLAAAPENKFYFDPVESQRAKGAHKWGVQITSQSTMQNVLRYNEFYAKDALNPVTGQQDPCAAIAPRCDLRNATHKLTATPFGVVDSTVVQSYMIPHHNSFHLMGPITGTYEGRYDGKVTNDTKTNLPTVNMTAIVEKFKLKADGIAVFPNTKNWNMMAWIREGQEPIIVMNIVFIVLSSIGIVILAISITVYMMKKKRATDTSSQGSADGTSLNPAIQDKK